MNLEFIRVEEMALSEVKEFEKQQSAAVE